MTDLCPWESTSHQSLLSGSTPTIFDCSSTEISVSHCTRAIRFTLRGPVVMGAKRDRRYVSDSMRSAGRG